MEKKEARRKLRKRHRLTQITIGFLQGRAAFGQNVHFKHRLWFHLHREGGDGTLIHTFGHVVVQTFSQLLNIAAEVLQALSILRLQQTDRQITSEEKNEQKMGNVARGKRKSSRFHLSTE